MQVKMMLMSHSRHRWGWAILGALLASLPGSPAGSQQSGTVLPASVTFLNATTAVMEIEVTGRKDETSVLLEFGPDGNTTTTPAPQPAFPNTARFTFSFNGASKVYTPEGSDTVQPFPYKHVDLRRLQPASAPGQYALSIVHLQEIPAGSIAARPWPVACARFACPLINFVGEADERRSKSNLTRSGAQDRKEWTDG